MRFIAGVLVLFFCGMMMLKNGHEDAATAFVGLGCVILAEIHKPEKGTLKAIAWGKQNLKWICLPLLTLPTLLR